jgi:hypothetical protein
MNMKRMIRLVVAVLLLIMLSVACSHYVCPAYMSDNVSELHEADAS